MITQEQQTHGVELMKTLAQKAWESSTFKEQLIKNPASTIESVTGVKIQSNINIIVEDQTDTSKIFLNIPRKIEISELELTDEQLEMVAGGTDLLTGIVVAAVVFLAGYGAAKL
jgi:hypothetical protein